MMAAQSSPKRATDSPTIPDRLYFKIGDVARICDVETYVLRFWETQFPQLKPNKSGTGQRLYRRRDVELALEIKRLVHAEGYTLSGARQALGHVHRDREPQQPSLPLPSTPAPRKSAPRTEVVAAAVDRARAELREIASLLATPAPEPTHRHPRRPSVTPFSDSLFPS